MRALLEPFRPFILSYLAVVDYFSDQSERLFLYFDFDHKFSHFSKTTLTCRHISFRFFSVFVGNTLNFRYKRLKGESQKRKNLFFYQTWKLIQIVISGF